MNTVFMCNQLSRACIAPRLWQVPAQQLQQTRWNCSTGLLSLSSTRRGSPKFEQKMLGSYPVAPEFEMVWRDRMSAPGGYIQQTISPYQLKFIYPFWHTFPARCWAKFSAYWWPWMWPGLITLGLLKKMHHDAEEDVKNKYWSAPLCWAGRSAAIAALTASSFTSY